MNNKRIIQWAFLAVIIIWGTFSLIVLAGEESADSPFTLGQFLPVEVCRRHQSCWLL